MDKLVKVYSVAAMAGLTVVQAGGLASMQSAQDDYLEDYGQSFITKKIWTQTPFNATYCEDNPCYKYCVKDSGGRTRRRRSPFPNPIPEGEDGRPSAPRGTKMNLINSDLLEIQEDQQELFSWDDDGESCTIPKCPWTDDGHWPSSWGPESRWCEGGEIFAVGAEDPYATCDPSVSMCSTLEFPHGNDPWDFLESNNNGPQIGARYQQGVNSPDSYQLEGCLFPKIEDQIGQPDGFVEVTQDCRGNPIPGDFKFYRPDPVFESVDYPEYNHYVKRNSAYHFAWGPNDGGRTGKTEGPFFTLSEAHDYCNSIGMEATYLWCPGNIDENQQLWMHHPHQPFSGWTGRYREDGLASTGLWTGIFREYPGVQDSRLLCGQNHSYVWYEQTYTNWRWKQNDPEPQVISFDNTYFENNILLRTLSSQWEDWCWHAPAKYKKEWPRGAVICEMNCDMVDVDPVIPEDTSCPHDCEDFCYKGECQCSHCYNTLRDDGKSCQDLNDLEEEIPVAEAVPRLLHNCPEEITPEEVEELKLHGCHCAKLGSLTGFIQMLGGLGKVDEIDDACKYWYNGRKCLTLPGGACYGQDISNAEYKIAINHFLGTIDCLLTPEGCLREVCKVDGHWTMEILKHMRWIRVHGGGNFTAHISNPDECPYCDTCMHPSTCAGDAPYLYLHHDLEEIADIA